MYGENILYILYFLKKNYKFINIVQERCKPQYAKVI